MSKFRVLAGAGLALSLLLGLAAPSWAAPTGAAAASLTAVPAGGAPVATAEESCYIPPNRDIAVARKVYEIAQRRNVSARVMLATFETAWVESHVNNLNCGDADSVGVFQQSPYWGWGTVAQLTNVEYATNKFLDSAIALEGKTPGSAGALAQAVQKSGHPTRYDEQQADAIRVRDEAFQPYGLIGDKWHAMGGANSPLGLPTRAEDNSKLGGRFTEFQRGMIIWHPNAPAFAVYGDILKVYRATGSETQWGFPIQDEAAAQKVTEGAGLNTVGRYQKFEKALFLWSPATGTQIVRGEIRKYFEANGFEVKLGYPKSDEIAENGGFKQEFQNGTIHWTPTAGASWEAKS
ncbi:LGFP repeat-containing protein [Psychromicrobium lacuslunae]|uniref:LGFP repeat-containing protein n=1 Tax=Psychromicrobium lacuslunae TaxID=1618207 RepID=UPI000A6EEF9E|nr:hypothetical protein [Psychromicrobium lacuslunae]